MKAGGLNEYLRMGGDSDIVFNEGSGDLDFRVESNSNAHAISLNSGLNLLGLQAQPVATTGLGLGTIQATGATINQYILTQTFREDAVTQMDLTDSDCQGATIILGEGESDSTIVLAESGERGQWFQFMSCDGNITIDRKGNTLNGGTANLTRSTNYETYRCFCYDASTWVLNNPA